MTAVEEREWKPIETVPKGERVLVAWIGYPDVEIMVIHGDERDSVMDRPDVWAKLPIPPKPDLD